MARRLYFDWAATAPLCEQAAHALAPYVGGDGAAFDANANSLHAEGRAAFAALERARADLARAVGARPDSVVFTGSATEADNLAVLGLARAEAARRRQAGGADRTFRVVTSAIEHEAVLEPARALAAEGFDVVRLRPDRNGFVSAQQVQGALTPDTVLVSVMMANNEVGSVQPVADIAAAAHTSGALVHTDAVQVLGKAPLDFRALGVDAMSLSAHKVGGPMGAGALLLAPGTRCAPLVTGGGQERGLRSGTQNVAGAVAFSQAALAASSGAPGFEQRIEAQRDLRDRLYEALCEDGRAVPSVACEPGSRDFLPNIVSVCVPGLESQTLVLRFDQLGAAVSGGSACSSGSLDPSHVLLAMGVPRDLALGQLRLSFGPETTRQDADDVVAMFRAVLDWKR